MDAVEVLAELHRRGVELTADGGRLRFRPRVAVTQELRAAMAECKADLLRLLGPDDEVAWRIEAMRPQVPRTGAIPCLLARLEAKTSPPGTCVSCSDPLAPDRRVLCVPCVSAIEWLLNDVREGR
jgi:hypothetical protein